MSGSMADHECKFDLCSKSLLQTNERYRLVDRIKTTPLRIKVLTDRQSFFKHRGNMLDLQKKVGRLTNTSLPSKG